MWSSMNFLVLATVFLFCAWPSVSGERCRGKTELIRLKEFQEKFIFSPGYPQNYEINDNCTWTFVSAYGVNYAIQLATIELDLSDYNSDCNTDYIEVYEGEGTRGTLLAKWCGSDKKIVKAQHSVTLRFLSDQQITGKGFVISYSLIVATKTECEAGNPVVIHVEAAPVYQYFQGKLSVPSCEWYIQSEDPSKKLLLELFEPSSVSCKDGSFDFYDGGNTSSHVSYEYCSTTKPFSLMFLGSNMAAIIFRNKASSQPDSMILKISALPPFYECTVSNMRTIDVEERPVIFTLPVIYDAMETPCPVRLLTSDRNKHLRLDVMGTHEKEADCGTDVIEVKEMISNKHLVRSCNRGKNPVYRQRSNEGLIVASPSKVYMRAAAVDLQCDGRAIERTAYESLIQEETIPSQGHYSNLDYCKYLIRGEKDNEIVHLSLTWNSGASENRQDTNQTVCQGDYINIYDGDSETSPVLFSSCWPKSDSGSLVKAMVQSSQKHLLVVLDADAKTEGESFSVKFHSLPGDERCSKTAEVLVTRTAQTLTSPNYPNKFPMNQFCKYNLVSENHADDIVVKVLDAGLHDKCKSFLAVYEGEYQDNAGAKAVGRVCGKDSPTFRIANSKATLVAVSEGYASDGGWRVEVHTEEHSAGTMIKLSMVVVIMVLVAQWQN